MENKTKLNTRQEAFCQLYTSSGEFFGNGVQTYIEVYQPDQSKPNWYKNVRTSASRLLANVNVCNRINELLDDQGLNDQFVDKQTLYLITQHEDKTNKLGAIREYNKLKQRITDRMQLSGDQENPIKIEASLFLNRIYGQEYKRSSGEVHQDS